MYAGKLAKAAEAVEKLIYGEYKVREKNLAKPTNNRKKKKSCKPKKALKLAEKTRGLGAVVLESSRR